MASSKETKRKILDEFRQKNFPEIERSLKVAISIRDDPEATNKDRLDAVKKIGQLLGAMASESGRGRPDKDAVPKQERRELTPEEEAEILRRLDS